MTVTKPAPAPSVQSPAHSDRRRWIALIAVCIGQLMIVLDTTIVNVALPAIQTDLHFSQANLAWVIDGYLITFGSLLLLAGRLGDLIGRKKVFLGGLALFTFASLLCGFAQSEAMLIGGRFLQGVGGAGASAVIIAIIVTEFPEPAERARAMSIYTLAAVGGGSIGLITGGILTQLVSWHWIFFVNIPIGVATILVGARLIVENEGIGLSRGVDWLGSVLVTSAMMLGVYAILTAAEHGWGSPHTLGFGALSVVILGLFAAVERRIENPMLPAAVLRTPGLVGGSIVRGLMVVGMFGCFFVGSLFLERVLGYGAVATGASFLPQTITVAILSMGITAALIKRFGARTLLVPGLLTTTSGLVLLALAGPGTAYFPELFFAFTLIGLGLGVAFMPLMTIAMADVPARDAGLASGILNVSMQVAGALGVAVLGTLATNRTASLVADGHSQMSALVSGYHLAFWIAAACALAAAGLSRLVLPSEAREPAVSRAFMRLSRNS
jgi:EmrB/QacA subfamily drug resistance transporter